MRCDFSSDEIKYNPHAVAVSQGRLRSINAHTHTYAHTQFVSTWPYKEIQRQQRVSPLLT